ncbi:hypothetical protein D9615_007449 [Tricholomella constricta]|uniref:VLRF1 domain-containing protein n=1 Tax=Tricholomella constricta TaxID=117010 RepID=A0A8H5GY11_9AGAR|nr:hypothetical protein D9615_007449 [Tricholomella constricta]
MSQYHIYSLPAELLGTLTPRNLVNTSASRAPSPELITATSSSGPRTCHICLEATFVALDEQRAHFRSDWHRYNVKTRLAGGNPVTAAAFSQMIDALEDSISGSESSSDEDDSSASDAVNTLVNKTKRPARSPSPDDTRTVPQTAITWFHSPPSTQIGVYKALYSDPKDETSYLSELKEMQESQEEGRTWAMFMVAGGHFAGAIVRVSRPAEDEDESTKSKRKKPQKPKPDTEVLRHKTFHRYTTRRKQGGGQSANDNAKGPAKSAGAQLRRYGEQSLREDIRNLLLEWGDDIHDCERIWIRASSSNRKIFLGYDDAIISKGDERLRTFPFPTRRPTQSELLRCLLELTRVKVSHLTEDALRAQDEAYLASLPKPKPAPTAPAPEPEKPKPVKLSREEELLRERWSRLLEMVTKGRVEPLKAFWEREASNMETIDARIPEWTGERRATLLQVAAQAGHEEVTQWLLENARADPTIPVPNPKFGNLDDDDDGGHHSDASDAPASLPTGSRRTAYDLARSKGVRDVFRRIAALHPDWWDWFGAARVPSALSKQMEDEREEKKKGRRKGLKDRVKEREARDREKEKAQPTPEPVKESSPPPRSIPQAVSASRRLGGGSGAAEGVAGLTPEMRAKVERERRARAAEARMKALGSQ